jgi:hypothetical protein
MRIAHSGACVSLIAQAQHKASHAIHNLCIKARQRCMAGESERERELKQKPNICVHGRCVSL